MKSCYRSRYRDEEDYHKRDRKFAKDLNTFRNISLIFLILWITGVIGGAVWKFMFIWGAILFIKGVKEYGWPGEGNWPGWQKSDYEQEEDAYDYSEQDKYRRPKRRPTWRKKDLV